MYSPLTELLSIALGEPELAGFITPRTALEHQSNQLFDLHLNDQHLIVKVFQKPEEFAEAPVREYAALQILQPLDIAPNPVFFHPGGAVHPKPVVVYEFMPGTMWDRRPPSPSQLMELAEIWLQMNAVESPNPWNSRSDRVIQRAQPRFAGFFQTYISWSQANFPPGQSVSRLVSPLLDLRFQDLFELTADNPIRCFSRADPRFANMVQRPDKRIGMVDWEDSGWLDPAIDVGDLITNPNQEDLVSPQSWEAFLTPYLAGRAKTDPGLARRVALYSGLFLLFRFLQFLQIGYDKYTADSLSGWKINGFPARERLLRYLVKSIVWPRPMEKEDFENYSDLSFFPEF